MFAKCIVFSAFTSKSWGISKGHTTVPTPQILYRAVTASSGSAILRSATGNSWGKVDIYS